MLLATELAILVTFLETEYMWTAQRLFLIIRLNTASEGIPVIQ